VRQFRTRTRITASQRPTERLNYTIIKAKGNVELSDIAASIEVTTEQRARGLAPATGARTLHRLGEPVCPLSSVERDVIRDFLDARVGRIEAVSLPTSETAFAIGVYCETHDPIPGVVEALEEALAVEATDPLADARSDVGDLL
jgi:hypothetical protein